jgi:hypothetical protein
VLRRRNDDGSVFDFGTNMKNYRLFLPMALTIAWLAIGEPATSHELAGYSEPSAGKIRIAFSPAPRFYGVIRMPRVPEQLSSDLIASMPRPVFEPTDAGVLVSLDEADVKHEYSLIVLALDDPDAAPRWYAEIIRQPADYLRKTFGFERSNGYSILGRRSVRANEDVSSARLDIAFADKPHFEQSREVNLSPYPELNKAAALVRLLWSTDVTSGPGNQDYRAFSQLTFAQKMELVRTGRFSLQCEDMRNLFLHGAFGIPGLQVRAVDALNYFPPFKDLIYAGHASAEVWVEAARKWVLVDPWGGAAFKDRQGRFLSAAELASESIPSEEISVVPLVYQVRRVFRTEHGLKLFVLKPSDISISAYAVFAEGHLPAYRHYFEAVYYTTPRIKE